MLQASFWLFQYFFVHGHQTQHIHQCIHLFTLQQANEIYGQKEKNASLLTKETTNQPFI